MCIRDSSPANGWGYPGGASNGYNGSTHTSSGGGGAGAAGQNSSGTTGMGGIGVRAPATFLNPITTIGTPGPAGQGYFAGGGASCRPVANPNPTAGQGGAGGGGRGGTGTPPGGSRPFGPPHAGAGWGDTNCAQPGWTNTGGGGGGSTTRGADGGPGIVMVAYPT